MGYEYINNTLKRGRRFTSFRYSPVTGFRFKISRDVFKELNLEKLEMSLTKSFMMVPEKSVTAICGVENLKGRKILMNKIDFIKKNKILI